MVVSQEFVSKLTVKNESKIVFLVLDGLGGLPHPDSKHSELDTANHPNMDSLAQKSLCGLADPVSPGITPGSGPGHLGLFGYEPTDYPIGRGLLDTVGVGIKLTSKDLAARGIKV